MMSNRTVYAGVFFVGLFFPSCGSADDARAARFDRCGSADDARAARFDRCGSADDAKAARVDLELARLYRRDPTIRMLDPKANKQVSDLVRLNPRLLKMLRKEMFYEPKCPEWYTNTWVAPGVNPNIHGGRLLGWIVKTCEEIEQKGWDDDLSSR